MGSTGQELLEHPGTVRPCLARSMRRAVGVRCSRRLRQLERVSAPAAWPKERARNPRGLRRDQLGSALVFLAGAVAEYPHRLATLYLPLVWTANKSGVLVDADQRGAGGQ